MNPQITLFDLLARDWQRPSPVRQLCFNHDDTMLACLCEDGSLALARLADNEPPEARMTIDNGQTVIRPRAGKPSPLLITGIKGASSVCAGQNGGFLANNAEGALVGVSRAGQIMEIIFTTIAPVLAFDQARATDLTAIAAGDRLHLRRGATISTPEIDLKNAAITHIALSQDGRMLACATAAHLAIFRLGDGLSPLYTLPLPSAVPAVLTWKEDSQWLACGLGQNGLCLIEIATGRHAVLGDFPGPVASLGWSAAANALFAAGAWRIAGWSMATPPLDDSACGALITGHPALAPVTAVAARPESLLVAAGHADGRITIAQIGAREELTLRPAGGPVTALCWTGDGRHLAIGDAQGHVAIVTFPKAFFK